MSDPRTRTTLEMDGLFKQEDVDNRFRVMLQCIDCLKWTEQNLESQGYVVFKRYKPCINCSGHNFDVQSTKSLRSFNILTDGKRKIKVKR